MPRTHTWEISDVFWAGGGGDDSDEMRNVGTKTVSISGGKAWVGSGSTMTEVVLLQWFTSCGWELLGTLCHGKSSADWGRQCCTIGSNSGNAVGFSSGFGRLG